MNDPERSHKGATVAQLKSDIDTGRTRDKVSFSDPGLSPLGTDDEAAGTPANPEVIARTRREEQAIAASIEPGNNAGTERPWLMPLMLVGVMVVIVAGTVVALLR